MIGCVGTHDTLKCTCINCLLQIDQIDYNLPNALQQTMWQDTYKGSFSLSRRESLCIPRGDQTKRMMPLLYYPRRVSPLDQNYAAMRTSLSSRDTVPRNHVVLFYFICSRFIRRSIDRSAILRGKICE